MSAPINWDKIRNYPFEIAALPDGGLVLAWVDENYHTHMQSFDKQMAPRGPEKVVKNCALVGLAGDTKGFAGIFLREKI